MSKQLPFKTRPAQDTVTVGTPAIGELEFPRYGSLLWFEREALRQADGGFSLFKESALVAAAIAPAEGLSHIDAHTMVTRILGAAVGVPTVLEPQELELRAKYAQPLGTLTEATVAWNDRRQIAGVTAVIANRLAGCQDWGADDTRALGEQLINAIYTFVQAEESGQEPERSGEQEQQELVTELGKLQPAPGAPPPNPTGDASTGVSGASTPEPASLSQTALALTPSATSSTPSKRASGKSVSDSIATNSPSPS